jgi:ferredoxin
MMESLVPGLAQWGVAAGDIHFEAFGPASVRLPADASPKVEVNAALPMSVNFRRSGRTLAWQGKQASLLDFAEAHGIQVESGCRSGSCGSCVSNVISGTVGYDSPPDFDLAPGQCLLCVGKPREALVLDT